MNFAIESPSLEAVAKEAERRGCTGVRIWIVEVEVMAHGGGSRQGLCLRFDFRWRGKLVKNELPVEGAFCPPLPKLVEMLTAALDGITNLPVPARKASRGKRGKL